MDDHALPMFPLGNPLLPHMVLPLHIFEPRYQSLVKDVLATEEREFGVVMIERGHEVGGGETRSDVGAIARIVEAEELDDGRWLVVAVGVRRIQVREWLDDDPYPCAVVDDLPDTGGADDAVLAEARAAIAPLLTKVLALASELGHDLPAGDLAPDPDAASYQASILAPLSAFDQHRLLRAATVKDRLDLLEEELTGLADVLQYRLAAIDED